MDFIAYLKDVQFAIFFLWGYVMELNQRITATLQTVTNDMLQRVLEELQYRIDLCHVSGGAHIEKLRVSRFTLALTVSRHP